ncbi:hypothetical protein F5888DRAFT_1807112 [Russula emetica]|nr:hypothetical protein F5888DRAFT_1807112 [Russula emetica]
MLDSMMFDDSSPPNYSEPTCHPYFWFSNDIATFQHFLLAYSSVFRDIFRRQPGSSNTNDNEKRNENDHITHLDGVTVPEFESLLTFFYEGWQESFSMPIGKWVALLAIAHRFRFIEAEYRAQREVFDRSISLDLVTRISLAEKHSVPTTFIVSTLEDLVRRPEPLLKRDIANLSGEMVARLGVARERYLRQSSRMFASQPWLKRVAHDIVKQLWPTDEVLISA